MANADSPAVGAPARRWARFRWLLAGLVLCRGLVYLCVMPPFEGWDEYQHVGYVEHVRATGQTPILWQTKYPPGLLREVVRFPQCRFALDQIGRVGAVGYPEFWARGPGTLRGDPGSVALYQAQHGPTYYRLAAPLFAALGGAGNLRASVAGLRLANVLMIAAAAWVAAGALARLMRSERDAAIVGLLIAAHPLFLINGARVANDALGILLATLAIAAALGLGEDRRLLARSLLVGGLTGLAIAAKAVHFGLVPFVGVCWLLRIAANREVPRRRAALAAVALGLGCLAVIGPDLRWNLAHYGSPTIVQEALKNKADGKTTADLLATAMRIPWRKPLTDLWLRWSLLAGGWSFLDTKYLWIWRFRRLAVIGLLGWAWVLPQRTRFRPAPFRSARTPVACLALCVGYTAALAMHMVQSTLAWGVASTNSWYACAATPWFLALVAGGALCWPVGRFRFVVPALLAVTFAVAEGILVWGPMVETYSGGAGGMEALRRLARLQPAMFGTATLLAAQAGAALLFAGALVAWGRSAIREPGREVEAPVGWREDGAHPRPSKATVAAGSPVD